MFGFIIGAVVGLLFLMIDSSVLVGLNIAEIIFAIIWIIIIYGCFGALMDFIIQIIQKIKIKRRR
jgi:ABC-type antimicrobial peptide transport system permease subunit